MMSLLVSDTGRLMTYAVVDTRAKTIVAAFEWIGQADKGLRSLLADGGADLALHNITHPKCPDWVKELVMSDSAYRNRKAEILTAEAATLRKRAEDLLAQADEKEARANNLRVANDHTPVSSGPGL